MGRKEVPPNLQTNALFAYDRAVLELMRCSVGSPLEPVNMNFATPRREFADQPNVAPDNSLAAKEKRFAETVRYPVMSVKRIGSYDFDASRFSAGDQSLKTDRKTWTVAPYPLPYLFLYQVDARTKYRPHLNQISVKTELKFRKARWATPRPRVDWGPPYGVRPVEARLVESRDTSILEAQVPDEERVLRHTFTVQVVGWLLAEQRTVPAALKVQTRLSAGDPVADPSSWILLGVGQFEGNPATGEITESRLPP